MKSAGYRGGVVIGIFIAAALLLCCPPLPAEAAGAPAGATEVARPSNPGGPGEALKLEGNPQKGAELFQTYCAVCHGAQGQGGVKNPGSTDGVVPPLNPVEPDVYSKDRKQFATNLDLFIEHGSKPEGPNPKRVMPAWGDKKRLSPQQIADVIAYIISINEK